MSDTGELSYTLCRRVVNLEGHALDCGAPIPRSSCPAQDDGCPYAVPVAERGVIDADGAPFIPVDRRPTSTRVELRLDKTLETFLDTEVRVLMVGAGGWTILTGRLVAIAWSDSGLNRARLPSILLLDGRRVIRWEAVASIEPDIDDPKTNTGPRWATP